MAVNVTTTIEEEVRGWDGPAVRDGAFTASYPRLLLDVNDLAKELEEAGIRPGARVALLAEDSYEYIVISLAVMRLDAAVVPASTKSAEPEVRDLLERISVNWLISEADCPGGRAGETLTVGGAGSRAFFLKMLEPVLSPPLLASPDSPAFIRFSSGTTGTSKGVVLSHQSVLDRTSAANQALNMSEDDTVLWVLDMAFHFVVTILLFLRRRCTIVIGRDSLQGGFSQALKQHRITVLYATPVHYGMLASAKDLTVDVFADVRLAISTAMRLDASVGDRFRERFGLSLTQAYGIIEVGLPFVNESSSPDKLVSVGRILPSYQVKFEDVDERGYGTILLRGKGMFDAYVSPFTLRADLCADGWFDTGDTGYLDEEGFLFIAGRNRSTINFAGTKVFPDEVEGVLLGHPDVAEARVLGRKASGLGEVPVAEIVLANAEGEQTSVVREIRRVCFQKLAAYKVPAEIVVVDSIPKTASGKVQR